MQQRIAYLCICIVLALSVPVGAASLTVPTVEGAPGQQCTFAITIADASSVLAGDIALSYDSESLDFVSIALGAAASGAQMAYVDSAGQLRFSWAGALPGEASGIVAEAVFFMAADAQTSFAGVAVAKAAMHTSSYQTVSPSLTHGGVENSQAGGTGAAGSAMPAVHFLLQE